MRRPFRQLALPFFLLLWGLSALPVHASANRSLPTPEFLIARVDGLFRADSHMLTVSVTERHGGAGGYSRFALWTHGDDRAFLRVKEPQREAGRAVLRVSEQVYLFDRDTALVTRVCRTGERSLWGRFYVEFIDTLLTNPFAGPYASAEVAERAHPAGPRLGLTLTFDRPGVRCTRIEVDFEDELADPIEARCFHRAGRIEFVVFQGFRDAGNVRVPAEVDLSRDDRPDWGLSLRFLRVGLDVPVERQRFTTSALKAVE